MILVSYLRRIFKCDTYVFHEFQQDRERHVDITPDYTFAILHLTWGKPITVQNS